MSTDVAPAPGALTDELRSFLNATPPRYATIAVVTGARRPHQNVIWYLVRRLDRTDILIVNSRRGRAWPTNLERERFASLAVHDGEDAVTLACDVVDIYDDKRARADAEEMAQRYDPPERRNPRLERFRKEERVSFVLRPIRVRTHGNPR